MKTESHLIEEHEKDAIGCQYFLTDKVRRVPPSVPWPPDLDWVSILLKCLGNPNVQGNPM